MSLAKGMNNQKIAALILRLATWLALPTVGCFGYYSVVALGTDNNGSLLPVILAYPTALIGAIGLGGQIFFPRRTRSKVRVWTLVLVLPLTLLVLVRL